METSIATDNDLVQFFEWIRRRANGNPLTEREVGSRWHYLDHAHFGASVDLFHAGARAGARARARAYAYAGASALDLALARASALDLARVSASALDLASASTLASAYELAGDLVSAITRAHELALARASALDHDLAHARALALDHDLAHARALAGAHELAYYKARALADALDFNLLVDEEHDIFDILDLVYSRVSRISHDLIVNVVEETKTVAAKGQWLELVNALDSLFIPDENDTANEWHGLAKELNRIEKEIILDGKQWEFTDKQWDTLTDYLNAFSLFADCLQIAYVTDYDGIVDQLFLPPSNE